MALLFRSFRLEAATAEIDGPTRGRAHPARVATAARNHRVWCSTRARSACPPPSVPRSSNGLVRKYVKRTGTAKRPLAKGESLREPPHQELASTGRRPALVRSLFRTLYAAYITN